MKYTLGVGIGTSHIISALVDLKDYSIVGETIQRNIVDPKSSYPMVISSWADAINKSLRGHDRSEVRIGIGIPGPLDYAKGVSWITGLGKYESLYGKNIRNVLASSLGVGAHQIKFKNDAACFLKAEVEAAALERHGKAVGIMLGTGLGTGRYFKGVAEDAEMWASPMKSSMAEDLLSTRWFVTRYLELTGTQVNGVKDLAAAYPSDQNAQKIFHEFADNFGEFLSAFIRKEQAQLVILGGNISLAHEYFLPQVMHHLTKYGIHVPIRRASLGEKATLIGAAAEWQAEQTSVSSRVS